MTHFDGVMYWGNGTLEFSAKSLGKRYVRQNYVTGELEQSDSPNGPWEKVE